MSVTPTQYNFQIWRGATFSKQLVRLQGDSTTPPEDLTGWSATLTLYSASDHTTTLLVLDNITGGITLGGSAGTIDLLIPATTTSTLSWRTAIYDLKMTRPDGVTVDALLYGSFSVHGP